MNYFEAVDYLNNIVGYIEVEKDDDYTEEEIIKLAIAHKESGEYDK